MKRFRLVFFNPRFVLDVQEVEIDANSFPDAYARSHSYNNMFPDSYLLLIELLDVDISGLK